MLRSMGTAGDSYDKIGRSYLTTRREDPHIAAQILAALGPGSTLNVGAGSGNYEPRDRPVVAVEPSAQMLRHRTSERAPAVRSTAEWLPFADKTFDTSMAVLTIHHWTDPAAGLREMARVSDRQVVFFFEQHVTHSFWALDYFHSALSLPTETAPPGEQFLRDHLDVIEVTPVLVPRDCVDGFGVAFWARPEGYLDPAVQAGTSWLAMLSDADRQDGTTRLRAALESGDWDRQHGRLREQDVFDGGYRIAVATTAA
jgi:SAM-dependent methyltransferase